MDIDIRAEVRRASRGDEAAAAALFDHFHPRVFRYARARLGEDQAAQDVAAETFARVLTDLPRFRWKGAGFEAWIFRIARNLIVDDIRHHGREVAGPDRSDEEPSPHAGPEERVLELELGDELTRLMDRLVPEQREVIDLRFGAGLDGHAIAEVMGKKPNAIRQLQFRALENLRNWMKEDRVTQEMTAT